MSETTKALVFTVEHFINGKTLTVKIDRSTNFSPITDGLNFDPYKQTATVYPFSTDLSDYIEIVTRKDGTTVIIDEKSQVFPISEISKIDFYIDHLKEMCLSDFKLE